MADQDFQSSVDSINGVEEDYITLHTEPITNTDSREAGVRQPPTIPEINGYPRPYSNPQILPRPELHQNYGTNQTHDTSVPQTSRVRTNSDSSGSHTPTEEDSPFGSPNQKHEELVSSLESNGHRRKDRVQRRDEVAIETYAGRLQTYNGWPLQFLSKEVLAWAGFYYTGVSDIVLCARCSGEIHSWEPGDDPNLEHRRFFGGDCYFN